MKTNCKCKNRCDEIEENLEKLESRMNNMLDDKP